MRVELLSLRYLLHASYEDDVFPVDDNNNALNDYERLINNFDGIFDAGIEIAVHFIIATSLSFNLLPSTDESDDDSNFDWLYINLY